MGREPQEGPVAGGRRALGPSGESHKLAGDASTDLPPDGAQPSPAWPHLPACLSQASTLPHPGLPPGRGGWAAGYRASGTLPPAGLKDRPPPPAGAPAPHARLVGQLHESSSARRHGHLGQQGADASRRQARGTPSWASCPHSYVKWGWSPNRPPLPGLLRTRMGGVPSRAVPSAADPGCGGRAQQVCPLRRLGPPLSGGPPAWLPRADLLVPQVPCSQQRLRGPGTSRCLAGGIHK